MCWRSLCWVERSWPQGAAVPRHRSRCRPSASAPPSRLPLNLSPRHMTPRLRPRGWFDWARYPYRLSTRDDRRRFRPSSTRWSRLAPRMPSLQSITEEGTWACDGGDLRSRYDATTSGPRATSTRPRLMPVTVAVGDRVLAARSGRPIRAKTRSRTPRRSGSDGQRAAWRRRPVTAAPSDSTGPGSSGSIRKTPRRT